MKKKTIYLLLTAFFLIGVISVNATLLSDTTSSFSGNINMLLNDIYNVGNLNTTYINAENITASDHIAADTIQVNEINISNLLSGSFSGGVGDLSGDPWWFAGVNWTFNNSVEINDTLNVGALRTETLNVTGDTYHDGDVFPNITLTFDLGSGANRWNWTYTSVLSTDVIFANQTNTSYLWLAGDLNMTSNNITDVDRIQMDVDPQHIIYDNGTCVIIEGDTSTLVIC